LESLLQQIPFAQSGKFKMAKSKRGGNDRYVVRRGKQWAVVAPGAKRASSLHDTQSEAEREAKKTVTNKGGGEVRIQGRNGRWRDSDTVSPGNDPNPPKDKKH
jgi:hypothetical protein